jgi:uncharacterized protein (TIGR02646 family)
MSESGPGGRRRVADRVEYERTATIPQNFPPHWTEPDVKGLLHAMQGRICAYCGTSTDVLDVEHFRPKGAIEDDEAHGGYWWLAYESSNYFLACASCNRSRKKTTFPMLAGATRCTYSTRDAIAAEKRTLLDPAEDPVEEWLIIEPDDVTAKLVPNPDLDVGARSRVQDAIDLLGLNLDLEVRTQRSRTYQDAARAAAEERWDDLRKMAMRHRPHSLAARAVLQRVAAEHLPSAEEEMRDLIDLLWSNLRLLVEEIRRMRARGKEPRPMDERQRHVLAWALTVLRSDPPAGDPATADAHLAESLEQEAAEIRTEIVSAFRALV